MTQDTVERVAMPAPVPVTQTTAVERARAVAEVAAAVQVAQQNPRDMNRAWADMQAACGRLGLAERAFYSVKNRGTGPSVHLARELARIWGNLDYGVHELHRDDERGMSEIRAYAWDQQTNVRSSRTFQVPHQRMANGKRKPLTDLQDVYLNNQNIGARAVRETILATLPADFVEEAKARCRETIERGDGKPLIERVADMVAAFAGLGVTVPAIERRLERKRGQWTAADVAELRVVFGSIKRQEARIDEEFPPEPVAPAEITPGYKPDPQAAEKATAFPGFVDASTLVVPVDQDDEPWPDTAPIPNGDDQ
ncbi:hypothetical protein [Actinoplanes sp. N902-109]|uniref:hypothetical protein n=1 Tax=Actinoplanes sp. (strain N902-109) TaxID=649831 RepID=UPI0003293442|nr:hypothetical protein [Actinoplanes sp. N902-109]AGL19526.1 hypothetical protein L083_6016 [Actinoplanes sp. N902-109]